jgi:ribonuclease BN (tRNA processing enzyme)
LATLAAAFALGQPAAAQEQAAVGDFRIITLGTAGGPPAHRGRAQPATLLQVGGQDYLIDAGEGAGFQLMQAGVPANALDAVFITHLHWDHTLGLDYLMASGWMQNRRQPLPVYGPPGLDHLLSRQLAAVEVGEDIFRVQAPHRPPLAALYPAQEVQACADHEIYRDGQVQVRAVCNSHFAQVSAGSHSYGEDRALSYRFDTAHGSVTITGDTGPSAELEALALGSDVLVAEVVDLPSIGAALERASPGTDITPLLHHMAQQHLTPQEVGRMATRAGVRRVILTHFVVGAGFDVDSLAAQVAEHFDGEVLTGHDLQVFTVASAD